MKISILILLIFFVSCKKETNVTKKEPITHSVQLEKDSMLIFQNSIEISENQLIIDDSKFAENKCPHEDKKSELYKVTSRHFTSKLSCWKEYLKGFYIKGMTEPIAQRDGDAGEIWETHSKLMWNGNRLLLAKRVYRTISKGMICDSFSGDKYQECLKTTKTKCSVDDKFFIWNEFQLEFNLTNIELKLNRMIKAPRFYTSECN